MPATTHVFVSGGSDRVRAFVLDAATGALAPAGAAPVGSVRPGFMALAPDRRILHGVGHGADGIGRLCAFRVDATGGAPTRLDAEVVTGARGGTHIAVHPSGRWLLTAHFQGGEVAVTAVAADGAPGPLVARLAVSPEAHQVVIDPTGRFVFVPCRTGNVVHQLVFDADTGALAPNRPDRVSAPHAGEGPRHMALHPGGRWAYVLNELRGTVTACRYDGDGGTLAPIETVSAVPDGASEAAGAHIACHPNGRWLYASCRDHHSIACFAIEAATGRLERRANETGGGQVRQPRSFTLDPEGRYLLVANQADGKLLAFRVDPQDGTLALAGPPVVGLGNPTWVGTAG